MFWQLELVARVCPKIEKMLFMFSNTEARLRDLIAFTRLAELDLWGGDFYSDELYVAVEQVTYINCIPGNPTCPTHLHICVMQLGPQLTKLSLVHTEELDSRAISLLSNQCGNLRQIGFYNCGFREPSRVERERQEQEEAFLAVDRWMVVRPGLCSRH